jgi:hypothetical protein
MHLMKGFIMVGFPDITLTEGAWTDITTDVSVADGISLLISNVSVAGTKPIARVEVDASVPDVPIDRGEPVLPGDQVTAKPGVGEKIWATSEHGACRIFVQPV